MRTTINLPDALGDAAKAKAAAEGRTFTSLVEEGLRTVLSADPGGRSEPVRLPTSGRPGGRVLIDLSDPDAVWGTLDGEDPR